MDFTHDWNRGWVPLEHCWMQAEESKRDFETVYLEMYSPCIFTCIVAAGRDVAYRQKLANFRTPGRYRM